MPGSAASNEDRNVGDPARSEQSDTGPADSAQASAERSGSEQTDRQVEQWVDRYSDALFRYAIAKTRNSSLAEELVQETFLAAISGKGQFRSDSTVSTWLFCDPKAKGYGSFPASKSGGSRSAPQRDRVR